MTISYGACAVYVGQLRQEYRSTPGMCNRLLLPFSGNSGFANAPLCCVIRTLPILLCHLNTSYIIFSLRLYRINVYKDYRNFPSFGISSCAVGDLRSLKSGQKFQ